VNDIDRDLMIRTVIGEAGNQGPDGMAAVAHVINNRSQAGRYGGSSPGEVVMAPNQFEPWSTRSHELFSIDPNSTKYRQAAAIVDGVSNGAIPDPTSGATHFMNTAVVRDRNGGTLGNAGSWAKNQTAQIGAHTFYAPNGLVTASSGGSPATPGTTTPGATTPATAAPAQSASPALALLQGVLGKQAGANQVPAFKPNDSSVPAPQTKLEGMLRAAAGQGIYTPPGLAKLQGLGGALSQLFGGSTTGPGSPPGPAAPQLAYAPPAPSSATAAPLPAPVGSASAGEGGTSLPTGDVPLPPARPADLGTPVADAGSGGGLDLSGALASLFG
jgi:hypothetical protein